MYCPCHVVAPAILQSFDCASVFAPRLSCCACGFVLHYCKVFFLKIQAYLKTQVKFVKRFQYKPVGELELLDSTTVLHFLSDLPSEVRIGYLNFKIRPYVPKPLRCFKCNRFGHVANHCKGKERCSKCGEQHSWTVCPSTALNCPNCHGEHAANDRSCPRYKKEEQVLKIKSSRNVSYAEAV